MVDLECIPIGAGHGDEGVCLLLKIGPYRILCDCGLRDLRSLISVATNPAASDRPNQPKTKRPSDYPVDVALCSHAHSDHARGLLSLHQTFPKLPIYATEVTAQLLPLNWLEAEEVPAFCHTVPWRSPVEVLPGLTLEFFPAGHLPGAAVSLLTYTPTAAPGASEPRSYTLLYTGDFLLSNSRLVDGLPLADLRGINPDVLIVEGSFGTTRHPHRRQQENQLAERMMQAIRQGLSVMLPVSTLGLAQELLMLLRSHHYFTGKDIDIWVEEPIAQGCDAYLNLLSTLPPTIRNFAQHQPLFWDERIRPHVRRLDPHPPDTHPLAINRSRARSPSVRTATRNPIQTAIQQRQKIAERPCIALVPETANIQDYCSPTTRPWLVLLPEYRPRSRSALLPPDLSFTAPSTLAPDPADLNSADLNPTPTLRQHWEAFVQPEKVMLDSFLLAEHCDGPGTTQLIHNLRPQHVVFIHGSPVYLADLTSLEDLASRYHLHSPGIGKRLELPIGEGLIQPIIPAISDLSYSGEVHELEHNLAVTLPQQLQQDPRWRAFADTGVVEASWQGEMLVLRSVSQRELFIPPQSLAPDFQGCASCLHYRNQRCWNPASSLQGVKVAPDGYCPAFEAEGFDSEEFEPEEFEPEGFNSEGIEPESDDDSDALTGKDTLPRSPKSESQEAG